MPARLCFAMPTGTRPWRAVAAAAAVALAVPLATAAPAAAAAPANDSRAAAQQVGALPVTVQGTTAGATVEPDEPFGCASLKGSLWYSFTPSKDRSVLLALDAAGDLDASVAVFTRERSQLTPVSCANTDRRGEATLDLDVDADTEYLVQVGARTGSADDAFTLRMVVPDDPATAPGTRLPATGVAASVQRFANQDDAWYVELVRGRTYRLNLVTVGDGCVDLRLFPAGTKSFAASPLRAVGCDAHTVFVAERTGRYPILVTAPRSSRAVLKYRLRVGTALADDTAPGLGLAADQRVHGSLHGSELDALDLYRFGVAHRSDMRIRVATARRFEVVLMTAGGRVLAVGRHRVDARLGRGRYFVAVRALDGADGAYVLTRHARTITSARTLVNGARSAAVGDGRSVTLEVRVSPAVDGPATLVVERFDPIDGWLFAARFRPQVSGGRATVTWDPPALGRYRVTGSFDGTFRASPSEGGTATFAVVEPLSLTALAR
jgi:hypothetical protein